MSDELTLSDTVESFNRMVIDEYYVNGFNGTKAIKKFKPDIKDSSAATMFSVMVKSPKGKVYFDDKRTAIRSLINVEQEQVVQHLVHWLRSDATDYLSLTPEELKALPHEARQCIESITHKKKKYTDREGNDVVEEQMVVKLISKVKALEILNKMQGYYAMDNMQKSPVMDLSKATPEQLNTVLTLMQDQIGGNTNSETIDI